jgi:hypothetical protein
MSADKKFDGFDHPSLPSVDLDFSCKSEGTSTQPEAVVDIRNDGQWVRLPVLNVETRENKDGAADRTMTSRVDLPATWGQAERGGRVQIYDYVGAAEEEENPEFDTARVFYWNKYTNEYSVQQFGYVASIGPSNTSGAFRFYIYDTADLMKNISVTKTYDGPTASEVADFIAFDPEYGIDANSPIPINGVETTVPSERRETEGVVETFSNAVEGWLNDEVAMTARNLLAGATETAVEAADDILQTGGHKHFRRNKHTLIDVVDWLTEEIGGIWYFRPDENGVTLVFNNGVTDDFAFGRSAYYDGQFDPDSLSYIQGFNAAEVDILNNSSLEDLKPINTLRLQGESADSILGVNVDREIAGYEVTGPLGAPRGHTDKYPHVRVSYQPLLDRAGGKRLGPKPIDTGKTTLAEAEQAAVKRFREYHEDSTDGSIEIRALPSIRPYDYIAAVPVCNSTFDADMSPIQYEVNSVVHKAKGGEPYTTSLGVSIALDESAIDVRSSFVDLETGDESDVTTQSATEL